MKKIVIVILLFFVVHCSAQHDTLNSCKIDSSLLSSQTTKGQINEYIYIVTDKDFYFILDSNNLWVKDSLKIFEPLLLKNTINCKTIHCNEKKSNCEHVLSYLVKKHLFSKNDTTYFPNFIFAKYRSTQILIYRIIPTINNTSNKMTFEIKGRYSVNSNTCSWTFELTVPKNKNKEYSFSDFIKKGKLTCLKGPFCEI